MKQNKNVELGMVVNIIEKYELDLKCRDRHLVYGRYVVFNFLYNLNFGWSQIGRIFNIDHATVISGYNKYQSLIRYSDFAVIANEIEPQLLMCINVQSDPMIDNNTNEVLSLVMLDALIGDRL